MLQLLHVFALFVVALCVTHFITTRRGKYTVKETSNGTQVFRNTLHHPFTQKY